MIADIVVIAIMLLCVFLGYQKGLIGVAVKILGFIAALIIALILYTPVSNYIINNTNIVTNIQEAIEGKINSEEKNSKENIIQTENIIEQENLTKEMEKYVENYTNEIKEEGTKYISSGIAVAIVRVRNMDRIIYNCKNNIIMLPEDKLAVIQDLEGYLIAARGNALLICKKDDQNAIRKFVNDAEMKFGEKYS